MENQANLAWNSPLDVCILIATGATFRIAIKIALVVGTLLTAVNQGSVLIDGDPTLSTWLRIGANYLIPYTVASVGYLTPFRRR